MRKPILLKEILEIFNPQPGQIYIDATINGGGHTAAILERMGSKGTVLGIDWDCELLQELKIKSRNLKIICDNYANLNAIIRQHRLDKVNGILFDLGFSAYHLEKALRGFSFLKNEPLDMRYHRQSHGPGAADIINTWSAKAIENILREFGEERYARRVARAIVAARVNKKISTTGELAEVIKRALPHVYHRGRIHPATRTFQALRIAVNNELDNLMHVLPEAVRSLTPGGKIIIISFHSLEDRIVKRFYQEEALRGSLRILTQKPVVPEHSEVFHNPRARSAKLRAAEKI